METNNKKKKKKSIVDKLYQSGCKTKTIQEYQKEQKEKLTKELIPPPNKKVETI